MTRATQLTATILAGDAAWGRHDGYIPRSLLLKLPAQVCNCADYCELAVFPYLNEFEPPMGYRAAPASCQYEAPDRPPPVEGPVVATAVT